MTSNARLVGLLKGYMGNVVFKEDMYQYLIRISQEAKKESTTKWLIANRGLIVTILQILYKVCLCRAEANPGSLLCCMIVLDSLFFMGYGSNEITRVKVHKDVVTKTGKTKNNPATLGNLESCFLLFKKCYTCRQRVSVILTETATRGQQAGKRHITGFVIWATVRFTQINLRYDIS